MLAIKTPRTASQSRKSLANHTISAHAKTAAPQNRRVTLLAGQQSATDRGRSILYFELVAPIRR